MEKLKDINCKFFDWMDNILQEEFPEDTVAICFNLYECEENMWSMELVGTDEFDEDDDDWACEEIIAFRKNPFVFEFSADWEEILEITKRMIEQYLEEGVYSDKFCSYEAVAAGFVDGDLRIIYQADEE